MTSPCYKDGKDCPKRSPLCHSQCEEYKAFDRENKERRAEHFILGVPSAYSMEQHDKIERKRMKKGGIYGRNN